MTITLIKNGKKETVYYAVLKYLLKGCDINPSLYLLDKGYKTPADQYHKLMDVYNYSNECKL